MSPDIGTNIDKFLRCILNIENWTTWLLSDPLVSKGSTQKTAFRGNMVRGPQTNCILRDMFARRRWGGGRGGNFGLLAS